MKLERPCKICIQRGLQPSTCMICGWKRSKTNRISTKDQAKLDGLENRVKFLGEIDFGLKKYQMDSTGSAAIDKAVKTEIAYCERCGIHYPASANHRCKKKKLIIE